MIHRSMVRRNLFVFGMSLAVLAAVGCGQGPEYGFEQLNINRYGWDSLSVDARFAERLAFGRSRPLVPQAMTVYLFNAGYDTLYAGDGRLVPIADRDLGDRESLMLEVCGRFETMSVCEQEAVTASPKRLHVEHEIAYPDAGTYDRGRYKLSFALERQDEAGGWERLGRAQGVHSHLRVFVGDQDQEAVEVPLLGRQGRFNLQGRPHYDDFTYHLTSTLIDEKKAQVHIEVYAGLEGKPALRLASVEKQVRVKTDEERALEVEYFVEQTVEALLETLEIDEIEWFDRPDSTSWVFNQLTNTYRIKMALAWETRRPFLGRRRGSYVLEGLLELDAGGANARFTRQFANGRTARRWDMTVGETVLSLGTLERYVHEEEEGEE